MPIRLNGPGRIRKCADGLQNTLDEFRALLMARDTRVHRRSQSRQTRSGPAGVQPQGDAGPELFRRRGACWCTTTARSNPFRNLLTSCQAFSVIIEPPARQGKRHTNAQAPLLLHRAVSLKFLNLPFEFDQAAENRRQVLLCLQLCLGLSALLHGFADVRVCASADRRLCLFTVFNLFEKHDMTFLDRGALDAGLGGHQLSELELPARINVTVKSDSTFLLICSLGLDTLDRGIQRLLDQGVDFGFLCYRVRFCDSFSSIVHQRRPSQSGFF